jgi:(p)ppGpp synthase/HD superfamily hydrolase
VSTTTTTQRILAAANFAARKHANQRRKGDAAEPYINHLIEVAELVSSVVSETATDLVVAALLHDTIEDAGVTKEELMELFGPNVAQLVIEVTDDKSLPKQERKQLQIENAPRRSAGAQMIQLADKISNLRSLASSPPVDWNEHRKAEYVSWAKRVVNGFSAPNPVLKAELDKAVSRLQGLGKRDVVG